ncbi:MAG: hypothetical protein HYV28_19465 [Ignavibacteriales bacterium]|nr:hypothetical protein [Ignavibacteriales bacterium]
MEIGGYFELELPVRREYYPDLLALNSGRSCLEYVLLTGGYSKLYLPYYICDVVLEPLKRHNVQVEYYEINPDFTIKGKVEVKKNEALLYVNYFGLMDGYIKSLTGEFEDLIVDNAQSFFSRPLENITTYYSPRKFFGVSDGGYLSTATIVKPELETDISYPHAHYLLERLDINAQKGYAAFRANEERFSNESVKKMSRLTSRILSSIDYDSAKEIRESNFRYLHSRLKNHNLLSMPNQVQGPMVYPLLIEKNGIRDFLIARKIYTTTYWASVLETCSPESTEYYLTDNIVPLPVDQRYNKNDMDRILNTLSKIIQI